MENSYFRSPYDPIRHFPRPHHNHDFPQQSPKPSSKPKVVSIPVQFIESVAESNRRRSAAVRIQRHLRGFLVRRKVEIVRRIEVEVDEIERRIKRDLDLLLGEEKERIRTNEMLMALLLRLDSVRGVRDYRKKVIRRAILLQETVDSLTSSATKPEEAGGKSLEDQEDAEPDDHETLGKQEAVMEVQETPETDRVRERPEEIPLANRVWEINETLATTTDQGTPEETIENQEEENTRDEGMKDQETPEESIENQEEENTRDEGMKDQEIAKEEAKTETGEDQEIPVKEIGVVYEKAFPMEEDDEWSTMEAALEKDESAPEPAKNEKENSEELGLKSEMERMVVENQNLKALVTELCERSSLQCKLMGGLAKRVAQLEKTVQTMERKKKKKKRESK